MELKLNRRFKGSDYTIGDLYINGKKFCETLEDRDRNLTSKMSVDVILENKAYGMTAIPTGTYRIKMGVVSPKFKSRSWAIRWGGKLPRLIDVKGFDGVLIHCGNIAADTLGCILIGENKVKGQVINSNATLDRLMPQLIEADYRGEDITLTIQ